MQAWYSPSAILTALTLRAAFHPALRHREAISRRGGPRSGPDAEGLIGSVVGVLGLALRAGPLHIVAAALKTKDVEDAAQGGSR